MSGSRAVLVLTSHARFGDSDRPTGFWYEELAAPYFVLSDAGVAVTLASPAGGQPPVDPASLAPAAVTAAVDRFRADPDALARLAATVPLDSLMPGEADGVFLVGGHGTMWDFPGNQPLAGLVSGVLGRGGVVGAVCHGAAAFVDVSVEGRPVVEGRALTAFSDTEEDLVAATDLVPFSLEQRLRTDIVVLEDLTVVEAHAIAADAEHALIHAVPRLTGATVHTDHASVAPSGRGHMVLADHSA